MLRSFLVIIFLTSLSFGQELKRDEDATIFPLRVSKLNSEARLMRLKITFDNSKFFQKGNRIEFWNPSFPGQKCLTFLEGHSSDYLLVRIPEYNKCVRKVGFTVGSYLHGYSPDLLSNLGKARELMEILQKKHLALSSRLSRQKRNLDVYNEKVDATNKRYEILKQKLEIEWQQELSNLEIDKNNQYHQYKQTKAKMNEVEFKMDQYRVEDQNLKEDKWSLDPKLYYKK